MGVYGETERLSSQGRGRGRGRGLNTALVNKGVDVQNQTEGTLVSKSEVKESKIINIKPKIKRVTNSKSQESVKNCISVVTANKIQSEAMSEPPLVKVGDVGKTEEEQVDNGVMAEAGSVVGIASLAKLESRISTLELEVMMI